ncbi:hypothetical protein [sulfur-oxidizing endosymbiont of Gigantopelta aegis]|uniref:hypothetical protein n=1 Tax=sulfur-oxidizing endosymbiont of Gigantopelta aegis TaxID=2794934 RepID=UPI0018DEB435|nr:hypothetical protein [sulfur-oxidizing endosymbiont of Gigantopelta aegis]
MKSILFIIVLLYGQFVSAALPPRYQNANDLDVMVSFINTHPAVASSLDFIDFRNKTVIYNVDCKAVFGRKVSFKLPGWVGPAEPLEFKHSSCDVDD